MKLVTINTHSLIEENYPQKLEQFVDFVLREKPDLIAMQEVNQSIDAPVCQFPLPGFSECFDMPLIRMDNHALQAASLFSKHSLSYHWIWLPVKLGYGKYDEGMAIFSRTPIVAAEHFYISRFQDYNYWKTRQILGVKTAGCDDWFYTVHMGWWNDEEDPFADQWKRLQTHFDKNPHSHNVWLLGDFNSPAEVRQEGYDLIRAQGWKDTYLLADEKDCGITVEGVIDGWRDKLQNPETLKGMRIDHIFSKHVIPVQTSKVIFNRANGPVISDHFGVMIETEK